MHTALDNVSRGVNGRLCEALGLEDCRILMPKSETLEKLQTYVPTEAQEQVLEALFRAGAGALRNYSHCSFSSPGEGSFKPEAEANPTLGRKGEVHREAERQLHLTYPSFRRSSVLKALKESHPYEEVAYEIIALENTYQNIGMGMIGKLPEPLQATAFLDLLKKRLKTPCIRHTDLLRPGGCQKGRRRCPGHR